MKALTVETAREAGLRSVRTWIARSVTVEPLVPFIAARAAVEGLWLEMEIGGYGSFIDELMNDRGGLAAFDPDLVIIACDLEDVAAELPDVCAAADPIAIAEAASKAASRIRDMIGALRNFSKASIVVQGFVPPDPPTLGAVTDANIGGGEIWAVREVNRMLAKSLSTLGDAVLFDQEGAASRFGYERWRDERLFQSNRLAVSPSAFDAYARGLARSARALFTPPRKVLVTDLDNTLWGGILGEDGADGIATGSAFPGSAYLAYQQLLKRLSKRGILLAIASKNNPQDVTEAFERRKADLALSMSDFAAVRIGWDDKASSLREMADELSLGLDSFVFVDDSDVECAAMRQMLPEVMVVQAPEKEPWRLTNLVNELGAFDTLAVTADDRRRATEYQSQRKRAELESATSSREEFLASLGIVCTVISALEAPLTRTAQLLSKTNQFNLTTRRHSATEIEAMAGEERALALAVRVRDRFGDAGVTGVALVRPGNDDAIVDTFLLSCRVIGRGVETALIASVAQKAQELGYRRLVGEFSETAKNAPAADFYERHDFEHIGNERGVHRYALSLEMDLPEAPPWIQLEEELPSS